MSDLRDIPDETDRVTEIGAVIRDVRQRMLSVIELHRDDQSADDLLRLRDILSALGQLKKDVSDQLDGRLVQWLEANGGELQVSPTKRLYVGKKKSTKCYDVGMTLERLLELSCGDVDELKLALSSSALKPGQCKELLGDEWSEHFYEELTDCTKEGKPRKTVKEADERFAKNRNLPVNPDSE